jgi:hypothetical protein
MPIPLHLVVEDDLSEFILYRVLSYLRGFQVNKVFKQGGFGYLKKNSLAFNQASRSCPFLMLTDLDRNTCPPGLIQDWLSGRPRHDHFLFRVAVPEVESWILADCEGFQEFLGLRGAIRVPQPEQLGDAKMKLLALAERARVRDIREALVYRDRHGQLHQGPDYNGTLGRFVQENWDVNVASSHCPSLAGLMNSLGQLRRNYPLSQ